MKTAIIGAGEIGHAIGYLLSKNSIEYDFWDKDPAKETGSLTDALSSVEAIFFCVPSRGLREALSAVKNLTSGREIGVFVSKGLESGTSMTALEIAADIIPNMQVVFLGGPMIAEEIIAGKGGAAVISSLNPESIQTVQSLIASSELYTATSPDILGVAFAGILKNIYAIVLGAAEGLNKGANIKGLIMTESLKEMGEIIDRLGGQKETAYGLAGLGDLIATGAGPLSSNWSAGFTLAKGEKPKKISEGISSFIELCRRFHGDSSEFKILSIAGDILDGMDPNAAFNKIGQALKEKLI